jgi:hypothetical protein
MPRFTFEKFPGAKPELSTMMKSVGETMAIGRTWIESLQKACRGLEIGLDGWSLPKGYKLLPKDQLVYKLRVPSPDRIVAMKQAYNEGMSHEEIAQLTKFDPWWLDNMQVCFLTSKVLTVCGAKKEGMINQAVMNLSTCPKVSCLENVQCGTQQTLDAACAPLTTLQEL